MGLTKDNKKLNIVAEFILVFVGLWASLEVFLSAFDVTFFKGVLVFYCMGISAVIYGYFKHIEGKVLKISLMVLGVAIVLVGIFSGTILQFGMYGLINAMDVGIEFKDYISYEFLLVYISFIMVVVIALAVTQGKNYVALVCVVPGIISCVIFGGMPSAFSLTLVLLFAVGASIYKADNAVYTLGIFITITVLYFIVIIIFQAKDHKGESLFSKFEDFFDGQQYEEIEAVGGDVGGGVLGNVDKLEFSHVKVLTVKAGFSGNLYLKGFTAPVYKDNSWQVLDKELYDSYEDVFDKTIYMFNINNQTAELFALLDNDEVAATQMFGSVDKYFTNVLDRGYTVKYEECAGKNYWYMPYGNRYSVSNKSEPDGYPVNCEKGIIASSQYIDVSKDYDTISEFLKEYNGDNKKLKEYIEWESKYRRFVKRVYAGVSTEVKNSINNAKYPVPVAGNVSTMEQKLAYADLVKQYLEKNFSYTLAPGAIPEDADFLDYFLNKNNSGYCTYFATAATLILRNAGIPARYVEGYVVDTTSGEKSIKETKRNSGNYVTIDRYTEYTVDVYDECGHAWVEIYANGYGWIPYEFTPGFSSDNSTAADDVVVQDRAEVETKDNSVDEEETESELRFYEYNEYKNLKEYIKDRGILDLGIVFKFLWLDFIKFIKMLLRIAIVLALVALIIYIPSHVSAVKKKRLFRYDKDSTPEKTRKQVIDIYVYLRKLCRFLKIQCTDTMSGEDYIRVMKDTCEYFDEAKVECIIYAMEKLSFGRGDIGRAEMQRVVNAAVVVHDSSYKKLVWWKKLLYRFAWHLY